MLLFKCNFLNSIVKMLLFVTQVFGFLDSVSRQVLGQGEGKGLRFLKEFRREHSWELEQETVTS